MDEISLEPMQQEHFDAWLPRLISDYAHDHVVDGTWSEAESREKSKSQIDNLLPQGLATPDHHFWTIIRTADGQTVGALWVMLRRAPTQSAFINDIEIDAEFRRRGYAEAAMRKLEGEARRMGADSIRLHVFGHNSAARPLYEKLGYVATNVVMAKPLT